MSSISASRLDSVEVGRACLELVNAVLTAGGKDVLRGLPRAVRVWQVLPLPPTGAWRITSVHEGVFCFTLPYLP